LRAATLHSARALGLEQRLGSIAPGKLADLVVLEGDPLADPTRLELIRRIGPDQEQIVQVNLDRIFAGMEQDVFLKPDDIINVGTNPVMPFLAVLRNAFRATYGFGFIYDRNFADIDSFEGQTNPTDRRRSEQRTRFGFGL